MDTVKITTVFDNTTLDTNCTPEWGFAAVLELPEETILFDTGNDGQILNANLKMLGFEKTAFSKIIISHLHWDHFGGLKRILQSNPDAVVYFPACATADEVEKFNSKNIKYVDEPQKISPYVFTLGEMPARVNEQALAILTTEGLVVFTGCAHPGIVEIVKKAREQFPDEEIKLVMGGFHLHKHAEKDVREIARELKALGVEQAAPTHCTGQTAIDIFSQEFGDDFIKAGVGLRLEFEVFEKQISFQE